MHMSLLYVVVDSHPTHLFQFSILSPSEKHSDTPAMF